ncbi:MAG: ExeM/NucH family extracellular endonuclease [Reinekea sp.]
MNKKILAATIAVMAAGGSQAELMISGIMDGPGSDPKSIEFYATTDIPDLSVYTLKLQQNGNTSYGKTYTFSADSVSAGTYFTATERSDGSGFTRFFRKAPDYTGTGFDFNGDDRVLIVSTADENNIIDIFGEKDVDGSGTDWEYTDGWAYRKSMLASSELTKEPNDGVFNSANWVFSGVNVTDRAPRNTFASAIMPVAGAIPDAESLPSIGSCETALSAEDVTKISAIQGSVAAGGESPLKGEVVLIEGIVTDSLQGIDKKNYQYSGFFIQEEDSDSDGDDTTSEAVFVYNYKNKVAVGDKVRLVGFVDEHSGATQIGYLEDFLICEHDATLPASINVTLPISSLDRYEQLEGMKIRFTNNLLVSDFYGNNYSFEGYGQFLASSELNYQPTEITVPSVENYNAAVTAKQLNSILIDDGISYDNSKDGPDPILLPNDQGFSNTNYFRIGYGLSDVEGIVHTDTYKDPKHPYFLIPTVAPTYDPLNAGRTLEPVVDPTANLKIASMNVLNLFNGITESDVILYPVDDEFPSTADYRGAKSQADYEIQLAKIVAALKAMDSDVIGLMEIENDGFGDDSSIHALTEALNVEQATGSEYTYVNPGVSTIGEDSISVGLLYRASVVTPIGTTTILDSENSPTDGSGEPLFIDSKNRPALIQSFEHKATGDTFTVVVNHLKSKGSSCSSLGDPDNNDGQGNCNQTRTKAVQALTQFITTNPTGVDTDNVVFMGDMNAYAKEDPIAAFESAGFINLKYTDASTEEQPFSYSYGGFLGSLDHLIGSSSMESRLVSVDDWHINSVESSLMDYDTDLDKYNNNDHIASQDPYYSSDHDPVIAGFVMVKKPDPKPEGDEEKEKEKDDNSGALGFLMFPLMLGLIRSRRKLTP